MRTRIFSVPSSGTPTATWQDGNATTGQAGALLPFTTGAGLPAGGAGSFGGPGTFLSGQFSLAAAPASLYVALDTNGPAPGITINLESYVNFAWTVLDSSSLGTTSTAAANLPAPGQLGLLRLRVSISGNASATCVAILSATAAPQSGNGTTSNGDNFVADLTALRAVVTVGAVPGDLVRGASYVPNGAADSVMGFWRTRAGTDAENVPAILRPNDFDPATNPQIWEKQL